MVAQAIVHQFCVSGDIDRFVNKVTGNSTYINIGEWVHFKTYAVYDGMNVELKEFKPGLLS